MKLLTQLHRLFTISRIHQTKLISLLLDVSVFFPGPIRVIFEQAGHVPRRQFDQGSALNTAEGYMLHEYAATNI
jgi:hypothetical protein